MGGESDLLDDVSKLKDFSEGEVIKHQYHEDQRKCVIDILNVIKNRIEDDPALGALIGELFNSAEDAVNRIPEAIEFAPIMVEHHNRKKEALMLLLGCEEALMGVKKLSQLDWEYLSDLEENLIQSADGIMFISIRWPFKVLQDEIRLYVGLESWGYHVIEYISDEETLAHLFLDRPCPRESTLRIEPEGFSSVEFFRDASQQYLIRLGSIRRLLSSTPSANPNEPITSSSWNMITNAIREFASGYSQTAPFMETAVYHGVEEISLPKVTYDFIVSEDNPVILHRATPYKFDLGSYDVPDYPDIARKLLLYVVARFKRDVAEMIDLPSSIVMKLNKDGETLRKSEKIKYIYEDDTPIEAYSAIGYEYDQPFPDKIENYNVEIEIDHYVEKCKLVELGILIGLGSNMDGVEIFNFTPRATVSICWPLLQDLPETFRFVSRRSSVGWNEYREDLSESAMGVWGRLSKPIPRASLCSIYSRVLEDVEATVLEGLRLIYRKP